MTLMLFAAAAVLGVVLAIGLKWVFDRNRTGTVRARRFADESGPEAVREPAGRVQDAAGPSAPHRPGRSHSPTEWRWTQRILAQALELAPEERSAFLDQACGDSQSRRDEIESLLHHDKAGRLDRLSADIMAPLLSPLRSGADPDSDPSAPPAAALSSAGIADGFLAGRYEILEELGIGGMGVVHRARDIQLNREVALKFLPAHLSAGQEARQRFVREARAAAALDHPNICTVHEIGETDGGLFIAMALYDGETLKSRLARGALDWEEALDIAVQVAQGLARAHEAGIVHRDIKPANVCLTSEGVVKIVDFGIAKVADAAQTGVGVLMGSAAYMSPEQARGDEVDARTDLWSLGVILYEMLVGERPFRGDGRESILSAIRSDEPVPLGRLRGTAPLTLVRVVKAMLAWGAGERIRTADDVVKRLRDAADRRDLEEDDSAVTTSDLAPEGERRQATVVVTSVVDYSALLERTAPAELEAKLARLRTAVEDIVRRHGGILNEFIEDRIVAVFGVPVTHEDDVLRAVRAAFELHELGELDPGQEDEPLALRSGIATGTLIARKKTEGERVFQLAGPPPRLAAQLAKHAAAGDILMDAASQRSARSHFTFEARDSIPPEEPGEPVAVARVTRRSDSGGAREAGESLRLTAFTGRGAELGTLVAQFERTLAGEGQLVTVVGEVGVGKSRLLHEFRCRLLPGDCQVAYGHCRSHSASKPYLPFVEALREMFGLDGSEQAQDAEARVLEALAALGGDLDAFTPLYLHLLAVSSERFTMRRALHGEPSRTAMQEALTALFTIASVRKPMVLLLEDWHWADEASRDVLEQLAEVSESYPLLVVVAYRPGYGLEWEGCRPRTLIHLTPLRPDESADMVRAVLEAVPLSDDVTNALHERSGGNPFFMEELCHSLLEAGMLRAENGRIELTGAPAGLHLPNTIQGVIRTRLDRLPPETREVVRAASVLGRDFTLPLLERLGPDRYTLTRSLDTLKSLGIVRQTRVVPEPAFRFSHVLTQEVAYDTLLYHQRKVLHGQAGRAIETLYSAGLHEHVSRLAYHFGQAEEWVDAVRYGRAAARAARGLGEFNHAFTTLETVREWLSNVRSDNDRRELEVSTLFEQEELCETLGLRDRQLELLDRVSERLRDPSDQRLVIQLNRRRGDVYSGLGRFGDARLALEKALAVARETGGRAEESSVLRSLALVAWRGGQAEEALSLIDEALRIDRGLNDAAAVSFDLNGKATILKDQARYQDALACLEEALDVMAAHPDNEQIAHTAYRLGTLHRSLGDFDRSLDYLNRARAINAERGDPVEQSYALTATAHVYVAQGRIAEAVETSMEAMTLARGVGYVEGLARSLSSLGDLLAGLGRDAEALPYLEEAAELFDRLGNAVTTAKVWEKTAVLAEQALELGRARDAWARCLALAMNTGDTDARLRALVGIARCDRKLAPDSDATRSSLLDALAAARSSADRRQEAWVLNSLGILEWERRAYPRALGWYDAALEIFRELDDDAHTGVVLNSLGVTLKSMGKPAQAKAMLQEAVETSRRAGQRRLEGYAHAVLGDLALEAGELSQARELFRASLDIRRATGDRIGEGWMLHSLARVEARDGRHDAVRDHMASARGIAGELGDPELLGACDSFESETFTLKEIDNASLHH